MDDESTTFRTKPSFQFFYFLPVLLAAAVAVDLILAPDRSKALVLLLVAVLAVVSVPLGLARVAFEGDRLTVQAPLRKPRTVDRRQIVEVEESARLWHRLIVRFHPVDAQGRIDRQAETFLSLPPVEEQAALADRLRGGQSTGNTV
jgi:hypothetical protein